jgi:hypothetical protein
MTPLQNDEFSYIDSSALEVAATLTLTRSQWEGIVAAMADGATACRRHGFPGTALRHLIVVLDLAQSLPADWLLCNYVYKAIDPPDPTN